MSDQRGSCQSSLWAVGVPQVFLPVCRAPSHVPVPQAAFRLGLIVAGLPPVLPCLPNSSACVLSEQF